MKPYGNVAAPVGFIAVMLAMNGCTMGPAVTGSFDRSFTVTGPLRIDLTNASGDVHINGSADGKAHVHGDVRSSGMSAENARKQLDEFIANPPIEQKEDTIRIGKEYSHMRNVSVSYTMEVPRGTQVTSTVISGAQDIRGITGPVKLASTSGSIRVEHIERDTQLTTLSGSVDASDVGDDVRASSSSGNVTVANAKGDVRINARAGVIRVIKPGGRVEADTASGSVDVRGAANDVKVHSASGRLAVQGNPAPNSFWELKNVSGAVDLSVPPGANFELSAAAVSADIRADVPIVIEEQGKHSLRAHVGAGGARVEVHTVSGQIRIAGSN